MPSWAPASASGRRAAPALACSLLLLCAYYRYRLLHELATDPAPPFGFHADDAALLGLMRGQQGDLLLVGLVAGLAWLAAKGACSPQGPGPQRRAPLRTRIARWLGRGFLCVFVLLVATAYQAHHDLLFSMQSGLTWDVMLEGLSAQSSGQVAGLLRPLDLLGVVLPPVGFLALCALGGPLQGRLQGCFATGFGAGVALLTGLGYLLVGSGAGPGAGQAEAVAPELQGNPVWFLLADAGRGLGRELPPGLPRDIALRLAPRAPGPDAAGHGPRRLQLVRAAQAAEDEPEEPDAADEVASGGEAASDGAGRPARSDLQAQFASLELVHPALVSPPRRVLPAPEAAAGPSGSPSAAQKQPWNVVVILMESTGLQYVFRPVHADRPVMPFLQQLSKQGLFLANHYSSSNSSPHGIFSIFSGLYSMPQVRIYSVSPDLYIPSLKTWLGADYDAFLVTPASLSWYFPKGFMQHSGFEELWGYGNLPIHKNVQGRAQAKDEIETVGFFLRRLQSAREPFVGVYYSFVPHWPYVDYGKGYNELAPTSPLHRYLNDLTLLDQQIERIVAALRENGQLERTILLITGDHGEAFGQHPGNYTHSRQSFGENFQTPALLYQPRLFPARVIDQPTSHVDLLPTLLSAMGRPYEKRLLQGESLFGELHRRYLFFYGNEDTLSALGPDNVKLQVSYKTGACWVYDLAADPQEQRRLGCAGHEAQREAVGLYHQTQQRVLRAYNEAARTGGVWSGVPVPSLK